MKEKAHNCNSICNKTFSSPFPRNKSNLELIKSSRVVKSYNNQKISLEVPASVTKSYMRRNPFYFDLKNYKNYTKHKEQIKDNLKLNNYLNSTCIFEKCHLNSIIEFATKNIETDSCEKLLSPTPILKGNKDKFTGIKNKSFKEIDKKQLIEEIINSKNFNTEEKKNFGQTPD